MSKYKGLFTFDEDNHKYIPIAQAVGIIDTMDYDPDTNPTESLIKDEKIRKAVRAWAEANDYKKCSVLIYDYDRAGVYCENGVTSFVSYETKLPLTFFGINIDINKDKTYTIDELCGEEK